MSIPDILEQFVLKFLSYTAEILPYFLLATLVGAFIQTYVSFGSVKRLLNRRLFSPFITSVFGSSIPVCSCSMIPLAQSINSLSKSYAPAVAFLISAPILSPVILLLMLGVFGWELTLFRFAFGIAFAVVSAYIADLLFRKPPSLPLLASERREENRWQGFKVAFKDTFIGTGKYVLLGLLIASLVSVLIPPSTVAKFAEFPLAYPVIALVSIPVYVCSGEEVPIAKSFLELGLTQGQALTFMLASSGICVPTIMATINFFPRKLVFFYVSLWFIGSILGGVLFDFVVS